MNLLTSKRQVRLLDLGCGFGYSTLSFALLVENLIKNQKGASVQIIGADIHSDFIEKSIVNYDKYKRHIKHSQVDF